MRRRVAVGASVVLVVSLLGVAVAWFWWIPRLVEERVVDAARARGLAATVGAVDVALDSVSVRHLGLTGGDDALTVDVAEITLDAGPFELASGGRSTIRHIRVSEVRVAADLAAPSLEGALRALRPRRGEGDGSTASLPALEVSDVEVRLRDSEGELLVVEAVGLSSSDGQTLRLECGSAELAPGAADGVRLASAVAMIHRAESGWRVGSGVFREVEVRYRERLAREPSALPERVRAHLPLARAFMDADEAESHDGDSEPETRVEAAMGFVRALGARLADDGALRLEGLSVVATSEDGEHRVLRELNSEARALPEGRYRFEGSGRPGRGGRLGWDLTIDPDALRAEGHVDFQHLPFVLLVPFLPGLPWHEPEDATVSGDLTIRGDSASQVHLVGEASVEGLALSSPRIAPRPVRRISASFTGEADWSPLTRRLELARAEVGLGEARATLSGSVEWPEDHYLIDVRATLPPTDCNVAVGAIPVDLLAEATAFTFHGRIGGQVAAHVDSRDLEATQLDIDVADGCVFATVPGFADVSRFSAAFNHRVLEPDGTEFAMQTGPETLAWTPISQISPFLIHAILAHEDGGFFRHSGFSVSSIQQALVRNLTAGRYVYGASTLTMQLVKNVFLRREKTLARKVQEVILTWWIESAMEKQEILELYLNVIEYGPSIYGIRAAAEHYFGRSPALLGPAESAYLATILPNPKEFHSHWEDGALPERHRRRVGRFLTNLGSRGRYDAAAVAYARARLERFAFHRPGESVSLPAANRGGTRPLPIVAAAVDWTEEELPPDDPDPPPEDDGW